VTPFSFFRLRRLFIALALVLLPVGLFLAVRQLNVLWRWPDVEAQVLSSRVEMQRFGGRSHDEPMYRGVLVVSHDATGRTLTAQGTSTFWSKTEDEVRAVLDRFPRGSRQRVRYDPSEPTVIRFDVGYDWGTFRIPLLSWLIGLASLGGWVAIRTQDV
jgi:hypothetical protein